jgi:magnesium and cobalt exporter, CNNM family
LSAEPIPISAPLVAAAISTILAGLFACADTALTSLSDARLGALAKEAPRFRGALERAVAHRTTIQTRYLAGRVTAIAVAAGGFVRWLDGLTLDGLTWGAAALGAALMLAIVVEVAASLGRRTADWLLPIALMGLRPLELSVAPFAFLTSGFTILTKWGRRSDPRVDETEVELMVDQREREGAIEQEDAELIRNVLEFTELTARDAMVARTRVTGIRLGTSLDDMLRTITESGHSRYPVYRDDMDDVFGLLYAKDLFRVMKNSWRPPAHAPPESADSPSRADSQLLDIVREPVKFVSESHPLSALLREMRHDREHLAVVVDEFGGTSGIVTLEDVLEEIVGDIQDEHDTEEAPIVDLGQGRLVCDATVLLSELSAYLGQELDIEERYDSLAGMLTDKLGRVPEVGTSMVAFDMHFVILESDEKHIVKVEILRPHSRADTSGEHRAAS